MKKRAIEKAMTADADARKRARFEESAIPHMDALYRTALRMLSDRGDAEDMVQDTFLKAYDSFDTFEAGSNIKAWLFKILVNNVINKYRRRGLEAHANLDAAEPFYKDEQGGEPGSEPDGGEVGEVLDEEVKKAVDELPEEYRAVTLLAFVEGFSYKDISKMLDIPIGTVMSRLFRARRILRRRLASYAKKEGYGAGNN